MHFAAWGALEKAKGNCFVKALGMTGFSMRQIDSLLRLARVKPAVVYAEQTPCDRNELFIKFCYSKQIEVGVSLRFPGGCGEGLGSAAMQFSIEDEGVALAAKSCNKVRPHSCLRHLALLLCVRLNVTNGYECIC